MISDSPPLGAHRRTTVGAARCAVVTAELRTEGFAVVHWGLFVFCVTALGCWHVVLYFQLLLFLSSCLITDNRYDGAAVGLGYLSAVLALCSWRSKSSGDWPPCSLKMTKTWANRAVSMIREPFLRESISAPCAQCRPVRMGAVIIWSSTIPTHSPLLNTCSLVKLKLTLWRHAQLTPPLFCLFPWNTDHYLWLAVRFVISFSSLRFSHPSFLAVMARHFNNKLNHTPLYNTI